MEVHDCDPRPRRAIACTRGARWVYQMSRQHKTKVHSGCPHRAGRMRATCRRHVNPARRLPGLTCTSQQNESRRRPIARRSVHRAHRQATAMIAEARGAQKGAATRRRGGAADASGQARGSTQKNPPCARECDSTARAAHARPCISYVKMIGRATRDERETPSRGGREFPQLRHALADYLRRRTQLSQCRAKTVLQQNLSDEWPRSVDNESGTGGAAFGALQARHYVRRRRARTPHPPPILSQPTPFQE